MPDQSTCFGGGWRNGRRTSDSFSSRSGVGTVTLPGLGLEVGGPAINQTPRRMMETELHRLVVASGRRFLLYGSQCLWRGISQTYFQSQIGYCWWYSIIATSGIVRPFSSEAFVASIRKEVQVAKAVGCSQLVINSGAKSERYLKTYLADRSIPQQGFVHYGNFIGATLQIAVEVGFRNIVMGLMLGKAVKLAEGALDTHSKKVIMNRDYLLQVAKKTSCSRISYLQFRH